MIDAKDPLLADQLNHLATTARRSVAGDLAIVIVSSPHEEHARISAAGVSGSAAMESQREFNFELIMLLQKTLSSVVEKTTDGEMRVMFANKKGEAIDPGSANIIQYAQGEG